MGARAAGFVLLLTGALAGTLAGQAGPNQQEVASHLGAAIQESVSSLQAAMAAIAPAHVHVNAEERAALGASQISIARNLDEAVPGLLAKYQAAPGNLGAAFRLYRDLEAVDLVAERSRDGLPQEESTRPALSDALASLRSRLDRLADSIQSQGSSDYAAAQAVKQRPQASAPIKPPATLVINDANSGAKTKAKPKAATTPTIPH